MSSVISNLRDRVRSAIDRLPRLSVGASSLLAALARRDVEVRDLIAIVQRDPMLGARIMQLANSGAFGRSCSIDSISHAVAFIGPATLRRHALTWTISGMFKRIAVPEMWSATRFSMHSEAVALFADVLADHVLTQQAGDIAFLAGLVHDIGKFILCSEAPDAVDLILYLRERGSQPVTEYEREVLGIDHAEVSSMAAARWNLPQGICEAVRYHHEPEAEKPDRPPSLSLVLSKSDAFVNGLGLSFLSSDKDATRRLEWPGRERAVAQALQSFESVWLLSNAKTA